jgi:hypothetical protein
MDKQELVSLLKTLQTQLESGQPIDNELRGSLQALDRDIQKVLAQGDAPSEDESTEETSLNERAQELEARFAAEHPYLASTLRDVMDRLGKMGI